MVRRVLAFLVLLWLLGFMWFAIALPRPVDGGHSDVAVVLTGGEGRIARGLEAIDRGWADRLLISGVDPEVKPREFAAEFDVSPERMECCVTLGFQSYDTRSNAAETSQWLRENKARSVRLITTDWHMRRAALELAQVKGNGVEVIRDAVASRPRFGILFLEYHKLLARFILQQWERWRW